MPSFITLFSCGVIFLVVSNIMLRNPPKEINPYKGYRTKRSKKSQEAWDFAQIYSLEIMKKISYFLLIASFPFLLLPGENLGIIIFALIVLLIATLLPIYLTEKELKERFGDGQK